MERGRSGIRSNTRRVKLAGLCDCEQRGREKEESEPISGFRVGCEMRRSVSDKVTLRHSSAANVQEAAEEMALKLWREGRDGDGDLEDIRTRWYLKPCVWMKSPRRVRGTWGGIQLDASI